MIARIVQRLRARRQNDGGFIIVAVLFDRLRAGRADD